MLNHKMRSFDSILLILFFFTTITAQPQDSIQYGAERTDLYLPLLNGKNIGVVANHTSMIRSTHLVDSLINLGIHIVKIFSPEHGFRGNADAGEQLDSYVDHKTGVPVISLYGSKLKPTSEDLADLDLIIFDIQDVGVRFYTYISTMHYVMDACAENDVTFLVLDRPNPNGFYVDGPVLDMKYKSFVGMHPVPVVHGMTVAEYAWMINEEGWLENGIKVELQVITCKNYDHRTYYDLPIKPSPNLPNGISIYLYPSLCLFEGTIVSVGRGTDFPFQVYGHPEYSNGEFMFTPRSIEGAAKNPKYLGVTCYGVDLSTIDAGFFRNNRGIVLYWLVDAYENLNRREDFFNSYFTKLAGTENLIERIKEGDDVFTIAAGWSEDVENFKEIRKKYLLYPDFE